MPTSTYRPLATVTLGSSASSVTFSSIPATYRDLILVFDGTTTDAADFRLRLNNDSGSNYSYVLMGGRAAGTTSAAGSSQTVMYPVLGTSIAGQRINYIAQVMDYSATDKHKTVLFRDNGNNAIFVAASAQRWANTGAVTQLNLFLTTSTYAAGCTISLYGVIA